MAPMHKSLVVLALLAGCGDDGVNHLADAPVAPDGPSPDAPTSGAVTLTVTQDGSPRAGVDVYFLAADNALVAKVPTNAQGVASATMGLGGSVTAIDPFLFKTSTRDLRTFVGVKPGDNLKLSTGGTAAQNVATNFTVTLPTDAFASSYEMHTSCGTLHFDGGGGGSGSGSGTAIGGPSTLYGCGATIDVLLETFDTGGLPLGAIYKANVALSEGATIDLSADAYTTPVPTGTINWANVPAGYTQVDARVGLATAKGPLRETFVTPGQVAAGAASTTFPRPAVTAGIAITQSHPSPTNFIGEQILVDWAPQSTAPVAVDLAGALLPTYSTSPSVSAATRTVTWAATGTGVTPDFAWATLNASRLDGKSTTFWDWSIVVPYSTTTFTLPTLPADVAELNFMASDDVQIDDLITAKVPGGYDAVRATLLSSFGPSEFVLGASGRIVFEAMASQPSVERTMPSLRAWSKRPTHAPRK